MFDHEEPLITPRKRRFSKAWFLLVAVGLALIVAFHSQIYSYSMELAVGANQKCEQGWVTSPGGIPLGYQRNMQGKSNQCAGAQCNFRDNPADRITCLLPGGSCACKEKWGIRMENQGCATVRIDGQPKKFCQVVNKNVCKAPLITVTNIVGRLCGNDWADDKYNPAYNFNNFPDDDPEPKTGVEIEFWGRGVNDAGGHFEGCGWGYQTQFAKLSGADAGVLAEYEGETDCKMETKTGAFNIVEDEGKNMFKCAMAGLLRSYRSATTAKQSLVNIVEAGMTPDAGDDAELAGACDDPVVGDLDITDRGNLDTKYGVKTLKNKIQELQYQINFGVPITIFDPDAYIANQLPTILLNDQMITPLNFLIRPAYVNDIQRIQKIRDPQVRSLVAMLKETQLSYLPENILTGDQYEKNQFNLYMKHRFTDAGGQPYRSHDSLYDVAFVIFVKMFLDPLGQLGLLTNGQCVSAECLTEKRDYGCGGGNARCRPNFAFKGNVKGTDTLFIVVETRKANSELIKKMNPLATAATPSTHLNSAMNDIVSCQTWAHPGYMSTEEHVSDEEPAQ